MIIKELVFYVYASTPIVFIRKILNTFRLSANFFGFLNGIQKLRNNNVKVWKDESVNKSDWYKKNTTLEVKFIDYVLQNTNIDDSILDVCCNQGRLLFALRKAGYKSLFGFDIMKPAIEKLKNNKNYNSKFFTIEECLAQDYFDDKKAKSIDWAITYSATIELIHPEFDIFRELSRVVRKGMFLVINEHGHTYPRFYRHLHRVNGFKILNVQPHHEKTVLIHSVLIE